MKPSLSSKSILEILLTIAAILVIPLFFATRPQAAPGTKATATLSTISTNAATETAQALAYPTATPVGMNAGKAILPTALPPTTAPAIATGKQPPACAFPLAQITTVESKPENYTFSEPQVVLTSQTPLGVAGWLPDGKQLLITRDLPNSTRQGIEVLNVLSGETSKYAERYGSGKPFWLPSLQAVVYKIYVMNNDNHHKVERTELWMSRGLASQPEKIVSDIFSASVSSDGKQVFFFSTSAGNMLQTWSVGTQKEQSIPLDIDGSIHSKSRVRMSVQRPNQVFWIASQSNKKWVALYIEDLLFLADTHNGYVCAVDLGTGGSGPNLASNVEWSTDGRYLAMTISSGYPGNVEPYSHILVLDVATGEQYQPDLKVPFVYEIAWTPNMHTLAALGMVGEQGRGQRGLFLLDADRKSIERVLPDWVFRTELRGALSWRPDGQALTVDCTTETPVLEFRICVTQVSAKQ